MHAALLIVSVVTSHVSCANDQAVLLLCVNLDGKGLQLYRACACLVERAPAKLALHLLALTFCSTAQDSGSLYLEDIARAGA